MKVYEIKIPRVKRIIKLNRICCRNWWFIWNRI